MNYKCNIKIMFNEFFLEMFVIVVVFLNFCVFVRGNYLFVGIEGIVVYIKCIIIVI